MKVVYEITIFELIVPYITTTITLITAALYFYMNKKFENARYTAMLYLIMTMFFINLFYMLMVQCVLYGHLKIAGNMYAFSQAAMSFLMPCSMSYLLLLITGLHKKGERIIKLVAKILFIASAVSLPLSLASANLDFEILHWGTRELVSGFDTNKARLAVPEIYYSIRNIFYMIIGFATIGFVLYVLIKNKSPWTSLGVTAAISIPFFGSMFDFFMLAGHPIFFSEGMHFYRITAASAIFAIIAFMLSISMFVSEFFSIDILRGKLAIVNTQNNATIEQVDISRNIFFDMQKQLSSFVRSLNVDSKSIFASSKISTLYTNSLIEANERFAEIDEMQKELYYESRTKIDRLYSSFEVLKKAVFGQASTLDSIIDEISDSSDILISVEERIDYLNKMSNDLVDSYSKVKQSMLDSFKQLDSIVEITVYVKKSILFIKDISEKTNTLSINANIQASKSSKWESSFGFVAAEIADLALDSKTAAERIDELFLLVTRTTNEFISTKNYIIDVFDSIIDNISGTMLRIKHISNIVSSQISDNKSINQNTKFARELNTSIAVEIEARYDEIYEVIQRFDSLDEQFEFFREQLSAQTSEISKLSVDMDELIVLSKELNSISENITGYTFMIEEEVRALPAS